MSIRQIGELEPIEELPLNADVVVENNNDANLVGLQTLMETLGNVTIPELMTTAKTIFGAINEIRQGQSGLNITPPMKLTWQYSPASTIDLSELGDKLMINVYDFYAMFADCPNLTNIDVHTLAPYIHNESVFIPQGLRRTLDYMFYNCPNLVNINFGVGTGWDTSLIYSMSNAFAKCTSLRNLDLSTFTTESLASTGLNSTFQDCSALQQLDIRKMDITTSLINRGSSYGTFVGMNPNCHILVKDQASSSAILSLYPELANFVHIVGG